MSKDAKEPSKVPCPLIAVYGARHAGRKFVTKRLLQATRHLRPIVVTMHDMVLYSAVATIVSNPKQELCVEDLLEPPPAKRGLVSSFITQVSEKVRKEQPAFFASWLVTTIHRYNTQGYDCFIVPDLLYLSDFETLYRDFGKYFELRFVHVVALRRTELFFEAQKARQDNVDKLPENVALAAQGPDIPVLSPSLIKAIFTDKFHHFDNSEDGSARVDDAIDRLMRTITLNKDVVKQPFPWMAVFMVILSIVLFWYFTRTGQ